MAVRLFFDRCTHDKVPCTALFVDVKSAFATLLRRVLFNAEDGDEAWLAQLKDTGFTDAEISELYNGVGAHLMAHDVDSDTIIKHAIPYAVAQSFYSNTWFSQESIEGVVRTRRGCLAGLPLADIIFSLVCATVFKRLHRPRR